MILGADARICRLLSAMLELAHFDVIEASSDREVGMKLASGPAPQAVIVDDGVPNVSGEAVLRRLRSEPRLADVPLLVLTPLADPKIEDRLRQCGATIVISKPFSSRRLLQTVSELIDQRAR